MIKEALEKVISEDMSAIWGLLNSEEKRLVTDNFTVHNFRKNQIIYAEKDQADTLWCLLRGKVKIYQDGAGGRQQILRLLRPVQYFGYRAYFANEEHRSNAAAFEETTLGAIPMQIVERLVKQNIDVACFFIRELSTNLGGSDTRTVSLSQKHIRARLAEALLVLVDSYGYEEDGVTLRIYMSREDLANLSNMTTSNAIRTLSQLVTDKLITVDGREIKILNENGLRKTSKYG